MRREYLDLSNLVFVSESFVCSRRKRAAVASLRRWLPSMACFLVATPVDTAKAVNMVTETWMADVDVFMLAVG